MPRGSFLLSFGFFYPVRASRSVHPPARSSLTLTFQPLASLRDLSRGTRTALRTPSGQKSFRDKLRSAIERLVSSFVPASAKGDFLNPRATLSSRYILPSNDSSSSGADPDVFAFLSANLGESPIRNRRDRTPDDAWRVSKLH